MRWRHAAVIVTADGRLSMVAIDMEATTVKAHAGIDDLRIYREFSDDPMDKLAESLKDLKLDRGKVGIELEFLPAKDFATLQKKLTAVQWVAADAIFNKARQIKTPNELDLLRFLSKLTDKALGDALRSAKVGTSEMELAGTLLTSLFGGGAESYKLMIIASGERSQFPNVGPTDRKLQKGDIIRMEIFGQKNGYLTGVCRTAVVGDATPEQYKIWSNLDRVQISGHGLDQARRQLPGSLPKIPGKIQRPRLRADQLRRARHRAPLARGALHGPLRRRDRRGGNGRRLRTPGLHSRPLRHAEQRHVLRDGKRLRATFRYHADGYAFEGGLSRYENH